MKTQKAILLLTILLHSLQATCNKGCLKCDLFNNCLFCDHTNGYLLNQGACELKQIDNCLSFSVQATCLACKAGYFLNTEQTSKCVAVQTAILNCEYYSAETSCLSCKPEFYMKESTCLSVTTQINNCTYYQNEEKCSSCREGYLLSLDSASCKPESVVENCQNYSIVDCMSCATGYIHQPENFKHQAENEIESENYINVFNFFNSSSSYLNKSCLQAIIQNCQEYDSFHTCAKCLDGYYLNSLSKCIENPKEVIPNCMVYFYINQCVYCSPGYYLFNEKTCLPVQPVDRCFRYAGNEFQTTCEQCEEGFYLSDFNNCQQRRYEVEYCLIFNPKEDKCQICQGEQILSTDGLKCFNLILNCKQYFESYQQDEQIQCRFCKDNFYYQQGSCIGGSISNCKLYKRTQNVCSQCDNGYYINESNQCIQHEIQQNCLEYHPLLPNICTKCNEFSQLFQVNNQCDTFSIENCIEYQDRYHCKQCASGYNLTLEEQCEIMPTNLTNCLIAFQGICLKCDEGFLITKGSCVSVLGFQLEKCSSHYLDGYNDNEEKICNYCQANALPFNYKRNFTCVSQEKLLQITKLQQVLPQCLLYYIGTDGSYKCARCNTDYLVQNGQCVTNASACNPSTSTSYAQRVKVQDSTIYMIFKNQCFEGISSCSIFGLSSQQKQSFTANHDCIKCNDSTNVHIKLVDVQQTNYGLVTGTGIEFNGNNQFYWKTQFECDSQTVTKAAQTQTDNCEYFYKLHNDQWGCLRCKAGYSGSIINWTIPKCIVYNEDLSCSKCLPKYYVHEDNPFVCVELTTTDTQIIPAHFFQCESTSFDQKQCHQCNAGYFLQMTGDNYVCTQRVNNDANCDTFVHNEDKCLQCSNNFTLSQNQFECWELTINNCARMSAVDTCDLCVQGFTLANNQCDTFPDSNCFKMNSDNTNCEIFKKIPFAKKYTCQQTIIDNCKIYKKDGACEECVNGQYLYEDSSGNQHCVLVNQVHLAAQNDTNNCKIFYYNVNKTANDCLECVAGFILKFDENDDYVCIATGSAFYMDDTTVLQTSTTMSVSFNKYNCSIYDNLNRQCLQCKTDFYLYDNNCCQKLTFGPECANISTIGNGFQDCLWIDFYDDRNKSIICGACDQTATNLLLTGGRCCPEGNYFNITQNACTTLPTACLEIEYKTGLCSKCAAGKYLTDGVCCDEGSYYNGGTCDLITNIDINSNPVADCLWFDYKLLYCRKCDSGKIWLYKKCQDISQQNCQLLNPTSKACTQCSDGYFLHQGNCCKKQQTPQYFDSSSQICTDITAGEEIENCEIHYFDATVKCQQCSMGYNKLIDSGTQAQLCCLSNQYIDQGACTNYDFTKFVNCVKLNLDTLTCEICMNGFYMNNSYCCPHGQFYDSATTQACVDINQITSCLNINDALDECLICDNYFKNNTTSCDQDGNSLHIGQDRVCLYGFINLVNNTECTAIVEETGKLSFDRAIDGENIVCRQGAFKVVWYNGFENIDKCLLPYKNLQQQYMGLNNDLQNCGIVNENVVKYCNLCIHNSMFNKYDNKIILHSNVNNDLYTQQVIYADFQDTYQAGPICCPFGYFLASQQNDCIQIPIKNCANYNDMNEECLLCQKGFTLENQNKICCGLDEVFDQYYNTCIKQKCENNNYKSNGVCCQKGYFWDQSKNFCNYILVPNCDQAKDQFKCEECSTGYQLKPVGYLINFNDEKSLWDNSQVFSTNFCQEQNTIDGMYQSYQKNTLTCDIYNKETHKCDTCKNDHYKILDSQICCPYNYFPALKNDREICLSLTLIGSNCLNFDSDQFQCLKCNQTKHLTQGVCCDLNQYFDFQTSQCQTVSNCAQVDPESGVCLQCSPQYYLSENICCPDNQYALNGKCVVHPDTNCLYSKFDQQCTKCLDQDGNGNALYIVRGRCCALGKYYKNEADGCVVMNDANAQTDLGLGFAGCLVLNNNWDCGMCDTGFNLSYSRCCPTGKVWNFTGCIDPHYQNCSEYMLIGKNPMQENLPKEFLCKSCKDNYQLTSSQICCLQNQFSWFDQMTEQFVCEDTSSLLPFIRYPDNLPTNCIKALNENQCSECKQGYILSLDFSSQVVQSLCIDRSTLNETNYRNCILLNAGMDCLVSKGFGIDSGVSPHVVTSTAIPKCKKADLIGSETVCSECEPGFLNNPSGVCVIKPNPHCFNVDDQGNCIQCEDGFITIFDGLKYSCQIFDDVSILRLKKIYSTSLNTLQTESLKCKFTQYLNQTVSPNVCEALTQQPIQNCIYLSLINHNQSDQYFCTGCQDGYKIVNGGKNCCKEQQFWNSAFGLCQGIAEKNDNLQGCAIPLNQVTCKECEANLRLVNGHCCGMTQIFDGLKCIEENNEIIKSNVEYCLNYDSSFQCILCKYDRYLTNGECCPYNQYFNSSEQQCVDINHIRSHCIKFSKGKCLECDQNNYYIQDGFCVELLNQIHPQFMIQINEKSELSRFPKCIRAGTDSCMECVDTQGDGTNAASQCCYLDGNYNQFYQESTQSCKANENVLCTTFDYTQNICTQCAEGSYFSGQICVNYGYYHEENSLEVKLINTLNLNEYPFKDQCQEITLNDMNEKKCSGCGSGFLRNEICCQSIDEFSSNKKCLNRSLFENCQTFNEDGNCSKCSSGILSGSRIVVCCNNLMYFDGTTCSTIPVSGDAKFIENCETYNELGCDKCADTFLSLESECCPLSNVTLDGKCFQMNLVENCDSYDDKMQCQSCDGDLVLWNHQEKQKCCKLDQHYDPFKDECFFFNNVPQNCSQVDYNQSNYPSPQCLECNDTYYLSNGYCCLVGWKWNTETNACSQILNADLCSKYVNDLCVECKDNSANYIHKGHCCPQSQFWNGQECVDGEQTTRCLKYVNCDEEICSSAQSNTCMTCSNDHYLYNDHICCAYNQYLDNSVCKDYTQSNALINFHDALVTCDVFTTDFKCLKCTGDTNIAIHPKTHCCEAEKILSRTSQGFKTCEDTVNLPSFCALFDQNKFICDQCDTGYYKSYSNGTQKQSQCCLEGKYYNIQKNQCEQITTLMVDQHEDFYQYCLKFDIQNHKCLECNDQYLLTIQGKCLPQMAECVSYDQTYKKCLECKNQDSHYLSNGHCCIYGNYWEQGSCKTIENNLLVMGCLAVENHRCIQCTSGYYLTNDQCCLNGQYFYFGANDQNKANCKDRPTESKCNKFGNHDNHCIECDTNYLLVKTRDEIYECISITQPDNCIKMKLFENELVNEVLCDQCTLGGENLAPYIIKNADTTFTETFESKDDQCLNANIYSLMSLSSRYCNKYLQRVCEEQQIWQDNLCQDIPIKNCLRYDVETQLCHKCETDYKLFFHIENGVIKSYCERIVVQVENPPDKSLGYIPLCSENNAASLVISKNVPQEIEKFFSIYKCVDATKIPFSFIKGDLQLNKPLGINRFNKNALLEESVNHRNIIRPENENYQTLNSNLCMNSSLDDVFTNIPAQGQLISNCAMAMINVGNPLSFEHNNQMKSDLSELSVFCVACKNGFKPLFNPRLPIHIYSCIPITQCETDSTESFLNGCSRCTTGFLWNYNENGVDYGQCKSKGNNSNCLASDGQNKCQFCNKGYSLNHENQCVAVQSYKCQGETSFYKPIQFKDISLVFTEYTEPFGCSQCETGYFGLFMQEDSFGCIQDDSFTSSENEFCLNWGVLDGQIVCKQCNSGYILTTQHQCIEVVGNVLQNCSIAQALNGQSQCYKCQEGYYSVGNSCESGNIDGCQTYQSLPMTVVTCLKCQDGRYLQNNLCQEGHLANCAQYIHSQECKSCMDGFALIKLKTGGFCIPIEQKFNCQQWNQDDLQIKQFNCLQCKPDTFFEEIQIPKQICVKFKEVQECEQYNKESRLDISSMECVLCKKGFYLEDNTCKPRTNIPYCEKLEVMGDKCSQCITTHYLSTDQKSCLILPTGIPGCLNYLNEQTCIQCKSEFYLYNNLCHQISSLEQISHCLYYNSKKECTQCASNYILLFNQCFEKEVECQSYYTNKECEICTSGKIIDVVDDKITCVTYTALDFCVKHSLITPVKCEQCQNNYFVADGKCQQVTLEIVNCSIYKDAITCSHCNQDYVLQKDGKACNKYDSTTGSKCLDLQEKNPFCTNCQIGFELQDDGTCVEQETQVSKCMYWNKDGICQFCLPGFFMDATQNCNE